MENLSPEERMKSMALSWKIKRAPPPSDIIWETMYESKNYTFIIIINVILFVFFSIFFNP
jgi:hypothetical protein